MTDANGTGNRTDAGSRQSPTERSAPKRPPLNRHMRTRPASTMDPQKIDAKRSDAKRPDAKRPDAKRPDAKRPDAKRLDIKRPNTKRPDAKKPDVKKADIRRRSRRRSRLSRSAIATKGSSTEIASAAFKTTVSRPDRAAVSQKAAGKTAANQTANEAAGNSPATLQPSASVQRTAQRTAAAPKSPAASKLSASRAATSRASVSRKLPARRRTRKKIPVWLIYVSWLLIGGLGLAAIGGTLLEIFSDDSSSQMATATAPVAEPEPPSASFPIELNQEIAPLKADMQELPNLYPDLTPKAFYVDVDTGNYVNLEGGDAIAAASTIKLPVLLAFFEEVDAGRITFEQTLEMLPEQVAEGSGDMQLAAPGTRFTALEVATQMIVSSDNTATNMMIDLLGGPIALNERFASYGLEKTQLNAPLPDVEGTNTTSAKDLVRTMLLISSDRLTLRSRDRILNILNRTYNKSLLAEGMAQKEALTYNKTGYIGIMLGDVALVDLSNGKRYIVAAMVERPMNDNRAAELIHRISDMTYSASNEAVQPAVTPLGDPDGIVPAATPAAAPSDADTPPTSGADIEGGEQVEIAPVEEPYPSANP